MASAGAGVRVRQSRPRHALKQLIEGLPLQVPHLSQTACRRDTIHAAIHLSCQHQVIFLLLVELLDPL